MQRHPFPYSDGPTPDSDQGDPPLRFTGVHDADNRLRMVIDPLPRPLPGLPPAPGLGPTNPPA
jgi:hypothetical protein